MKHQFYVRGTMIGLIVGTLIAHFILYKLFGGGFLKTLMFDKRVNGITSVLFGISCSMTMAIIFDRRGLQPNFIKRSLLYPAMIFLVGSTAGSFLNLVCNGNLMEKQSWLDWFYRPLFWIDYVGLPFCLVFGILYDKGFRRWVKRVANQKP